MEIEANPDYMSTTTFKQLCQYIQLPAFGHRDAFISQAGWQLRFTTHIPILANYGPASEWEFRGERQIIGIPGNFCDLLKFLDVLAVS
ncbi:MAG: hypothetical protein CMQ17_02215 [Gammaproteobacteria bacterium]|nr:hypothetical protein [Gammaproteobacteria bacterium]